MASYRDFEKLWEQYQKEGAKRDISIELYCKSKGVVYAHFERWYREYFRKKAYEVEFINNPETDVITEPKSSVEDEKVIATSSTTEPATITKIDLRLSNGIEYHAEQITSSALASLITKLRRYVWVNRSDEVLLYAQRDRYAIGLRKALGNSKVTIWTQPQKWRCIYVHLEGST